MRAVCYDLDVRKPGYSALSGARFMPLFGFVCEKCHHEHELLVRADAKPVCPDCGSKQMTKLMSAFAPQTARAAEPPSPCAAASCCRMPGGCAMN